MVHSYDAEVAKRYGFACAVLLYNFYFWVENNKGNNKNCHDGKYWTYQSMKGLTYYFPEMSESTIKRAIKRLSDEGIIEIGTFNKTAYDRTNWYTLTKLGESIMSNCTYRLGQNDPMDSVNMNQPIPDTTTDKKTDSTRATGQNDRSASSSRSKEDVDKVTSAWNAMAKDVGLVMISKLTPTSFRCKMLKERIAEYGLDDIMLAIANVRKSQFLQGKNNRNWKIDFEWLVRPNNFPKVLEGKYSDKDVVEEEEEYRDPKFEPEIAVDRSYLEGY